MLNRITEWVKGETYEIETTIDRLDLSGLVPACGRWSEEPYRLRVWAIQKTTRRAANWVKPQISYRYEVEPLTTHLVPIDIRCKTIIVTEDLGRYATVVATNPREAAIEFLIHLQELREKFQEKFQEEKLALTA